MWSVEINRSKFCENKPFLLQPQHPQKGVSSNLRFQQGALLNAALAYGREGFQLFILASVPSWILLMQSLWQLQFSTTRPCRTMCPSLHRMWIWAIWRSQCLRPQPTSMVTLSAGDLSSSSLHKWLYVTLNMTIQSVHKP